MKLPVEPKTAECKTCHAPIYWAKVKKKDGKIGNQPLDKDPTPEGTHRARLEVKVNDEGRTDLIVHAEWVPPKERAALAAKGVRLRVSHFATCPDAKDFRGGSK